MLLFWVNSVLKSLVSAFTPVRNLGEGIGGIGLSSPPLIFRPDWGPKGRKKFFGDRPPPPPPHPFISGSGWPQPLIWRSGWALYHWGWFHTVMALNLKKLARLFQVSNPCLSLPSVATEDRKQFQCPLLLEFNWYEDTFWLIKKIANIPWRRPYNYSADIIGNCTSTTRKLDYMETKTKTASENRDL